MGGMNHSTRVAGSLSWYKEYICIYISCLGELPGERRRARAWRRLSRELNVYGVHTVPQTRKRKGKLSAFPAGRSERKPSPAERLLGFAQTLDSD